jgi:hypothetical protein
LEKNMKNILFYTMYFPVHTDVNTNTDTSLREFCNIICNNREHRKSEHLWFSGFAKNQRSKHFFIPASSSHTQVHEVSDSPL